MSRLKKLSERARYRAGKPKGLTIRDLLSACDIEPMLKLFAPDKRKLRKEYRRRKASGIPEFVTWQRQIP